MNHRTIAVFLGAVMVGAIAASVGVAEAATSYRVHSSGCYNAGASAAMTDNNFGITDNASFNATESLVCSAPDSNVIPRETFTQVNVEVFIPSFTGSSIAAMLCEDTWNGTGGACSSQPNTGSSTGHQTLFLGGLVDSNVWTTSSQSTANFGYVWVDLAPGTRLSGIFYSQ